MMEARGVTTIKTPPVWAALLVLAQVCLASCATTPSEPELSSLYTSDLAGTRWGIVISRMDGTDLLSHRGDDRFSPASNTKLFTTAAAFHTLTNLDTPSPHLATHVLLEPRQDGRPADLVLVGAADALLNDAPDCEVSCLADLADQVVAAGITQVSDIIGDDRLFPDERWGPGWSVEDLETYYGTAVSALTLNDNSVTLVVSPGQSAGSAGTSDLRVERLTGSDLVHIYGTLSLSDSQRSIPLGLHDPAAFAASRFSRLLSQRGISTTGRANSRHRSLSLADDPESGVTSADLVTSQPGRPIASLPGSPLHDTLTIISKRSQNLYAELVLRQIGLADGIGSRQSGLKVIDDMMALTGAPERGYDFSDGSGMSIYNRVSPHAVVDLLTWAQAQDWGDAFKATLPVAGVDGSLRNRFKDTPLQGRLFAKTGTLRGVNALSGYMITARGEQLAFSIIANDRPPEAGSALEEMDAFLVEFARTH